ncbi:MAG: hypothetical protein IPM37_03675 [Hahellaceae bacterium]|nr:hypothetical protein [Hahellaceae bacterium]
MFDGKNDLSPALNIKGECGATLYGGICGCCGIPLTSYCVHSLLPKTTIGKLSNYLFKYRALCGNTLILNVFVVVWVHGRVLHYKQLQKNSLSFRFSIIRVPCCLAKEEDYLWGTRRCLPVKPFL